MYMNRKFYAVNLTPIPAPKLPRIRALPRSAYASCARPHAPAQPAELARAHANQAHARAHYMSYISSSVSMISDEKVYTMVEQ